MVGLFWESESQRGVVDSLALSEVLLEISKSFSNLNQVDKACILACTLHTQEQQHLQNNGFEVNLFFFLDNNNFPYLNQMTHLFDVFLFF